MNEDVKNEITVALDLLKNVLIKNAVSMATDPHGNIYFFDTDIYLTTGMLSGLSVNVNELV